MVKLIKGNIFNAKTQTIVNTINCMEVMGKGIALVFKLRYPQMFDLRPRKEIGERGTELNKEEQS